MKKMNLIMIFLGAITAILLGCGNTEKIEDSDRSGETIRYFTSWSGYSFPPKPVGEITKEEALLIKDYYVVHYNSIGQIDVFTSIIDGGVFGSQEFTYHENRKLKRVKNIHPDGSITFQDFDEKGKRLKKL